MRSRYVLALPLAALLAMPVTSNAQTSLDGFGALPINQAASFVESGRPLDFGGRVSLNLTPNLQAIGEFGRLGNVLPSIVGFPLSLSPVDLRVSAFYGEGGARFLASPHSAVSPYGEATAGVAHLRLGLSGLGSSGDAVARAIFNLVDMRDPMVGAGGGVILRSGPVHVDLGYRYKRILSNSAFSSIIGFGQELRSHQLRFGVGVSF